MRRSKLKHDGFFVFVLLFLFLFTNSCICRQFAVNYDGTQFPEVTDFVKQSDGGNKIGYQNFDQDEPNSTTTTYHACSIIFKKQTRTQQKSVQKPMALCYTETYGKNFGDALGPAIVRKILDNHFNSPSVGEKVGIKSLNHHNYPVLNFANRTIKRRFFGNVTCFYVVGSVLQHVLSGDFVWGIGANPKQLHKHTIPSNITFYAVRGPNTWNQFLQNQHPNQTMVVSRHLAVSTEQSVFTNASTFGDPGFLIPFLYPKFRKNALQRQTFWSRDDQQTRTKFCVVPHFNDLLEPDIEHLVSQETYDGNITVISPHNEWEDVLSQIHRCDYVMASSLHGIIVADAIGIPTQWFQIPRGKTSISEGFFKYQDYYGSLSPYRDAKWTPHTSVNQILNTSAYNSVLPFIVRKQYAQNLLDSFPFHLFERTCL